jgi:hypothetical protein
MRGRNNRAVSRPDVIRLAGMIDLSGRVFESEAPERRPRVRDQTARSRMRSRQGRRYICGRPGIISVCDLRAGDMARGLMSHAADLQRMQ